MVNVGFIWLVGCFAMNFVNFLNCHRVHSYTWCEPREPRRILNGEPGKDSDV